MSDINTKNFFEDSPFLVPLYRLIELDIHTPSRTAQATRFHENALTTKTDRSTFYLIHLSQQANTPS